MSQLGQLEGKVGVVVGGGGGIGGACVRVLAREGAQVVVVDRAADTAARAANSVGGHAFTADVGDEADVGRLVEAIEREIGGVDVLVNCAALFQAPAPPEKLGLEKWDQVMRVTLRGAYLTCLLFGSRMARQGGGAIVNIASLAGMRALPFHAYGPAKAAVISMTEILAAEWGPSRVRVNALSPGFTRTPDVQAAINAGEFKADVLSSTPLGRLVEPEEVAAAALFLASPAASAITGINLPVECGWLAGSAWQAYGGLRPATTI